VRVAILGVGLIGGSVGLAARRRAGAHVCGYDPDQAALQTAIELGAIDEGAPDLPTAVAGAQVVFAAAPVGALAQSVSEALAHAGPDCVLSDVGSTKLALDSARSDPRFVGGHPLAGAETAGVRHAREELFEGASWYLTPTANTDTELYERLRSLIERFGARPAAITPEAHDRLMASVSHLPHVLANVLAAQAVDALEREGEGEGAKGEERRGAGPRAISIPPSLADAIRVAGSNTAIWTDIYLANREALSRAIDEAIQGLEEVRSHLGQGDVAALADWNEHARAAREVLLGADPA
jgi:prephenate dehydrogenase